MNTHVRTRKEQEYNAGIAYITPLLQQLRADKSHALVSRANTIECEIYLNRSMSIDFHGGVIDTLNKEIPEYSFAVDYTCHRYAVWAKRKQH